MLKLKRMSSVYDSKVYTSDGDFFGVVVDAEIISNRVYGWKIKPVKDSVLARTIGNARGVIVPHKLVEAIGDIMIISKSAIPTPSSEDLGVKDLSSSENL